MTKKEFVRHMSALGHSSVAIYRMDGGQIAVAVSGHPLTEWGEPDIIYGKALELVPPPTYIDPSLSIKERESKWEF
jgi:hypothetical protein